MSDQVERKKSYRWVSASQASYDGADWDSSDEDYSDVDGDKKDSKPSRRGTIGKLPKLPKLTYDEDDGTQENLERERADGDAEKEEHKSIEKGEAASSVESKADTCQKIVSQSVHMEESRSSLDSPSLAKVSSLNSSRSSMQNRRTPVNAGLENLMAQISKEMSPDVKQAERFEGFENFDKESNIAAQNSEDDRISVIDHNDGATNEDSDVNSQDTGHKADHEELENQSSDNEEYRVSRTGYFADYIGSEDENQDSVSSDSKLIDEEKSLENRDANERNNGPRVPSEQEKTQAVENKEMEKEDSTEPEENYATPDLQAPEGVMAPPYHGDHVDSSSIDDEQSASEDEQRSRDDLSNNVSEAGQSLYDDYSTDDVDDGLSYTDSIKYQANCSGPESGEDLASNLSPPNDKESFKSDNAQQQQRRSSSTHDANEDEHLNISKSGYFNKMVRGADIDEQEGSSEEASEEETKKNYNGDLGSDKSTSSKGVINEKDNDTRSVRSTELVNTHDVKEQSEGGRAEERQSISARYDAEEGSSINGSKEHKYDGQKNPSSTRESINLGKWRPDTEAFRNGFVEETSNNAPPGYVYDENGKLINLTPSSMKSRVPSAYTEAESSWNAFPSEGMDDLETIKDTKTIYDNNTVFNVPGIIANNQNAPPLPDYGTQMSQNDSSDDPKSFGTAGTTSTLEGERGPIQTHFKEIFSVQQPDSEEIARLSQEKKVPFVDINKVLNSKSTRENKIQQLRDYSQQLQNYDTGIQTWLSYSLKSSSKSDRDYLFDEYKVSNHVRDAYAHADELSRKHSVINTVASVNQNMTHLTKKVISHSRKSRGLFSSIGKKKV